ncbi:polysaccharide pyruvyl transferase family protein [Lutibacter sp.]
MSYIKYLKNYTKGYLKTVLKKQVIKEKPYKDIGILNPAIGTSNLGDLIINESVSKVLRNIYPNDLFTDFPTQLHTSYDAMVLMREKDYLFVAGTNLLSSNLETRYQWKISKRHNKFLENKVVLLGVGWWQYQDKINMYSKNIYKKILNKDVLHSVRDEYTVKKLNEIGVYNVVNTTCPTLWSLTPQKCRIIPTRKSQRVVTTLTFYNKNPKDDLKMLEILSSNYQKVYLWVQGMHDVTYFNEINKNINNIELLPPTINSFNSIIKGGNIDYIGTRLHAGVRALQRNIRTLILAVDNRALEIGHDTNLNVIKREDVTNIQNFINQEYITEIKLPQKNINLWLNSIKNTK